MNIKNTSNPKGIYAINKPKGFTSHDVIAKLRGITGIKKIGHAGTLDPMATGVLVVAIGREYTKQISTIVKKEKEYLAEITLGATSDTDDAEGKIKEITVENTPSEQEIKQLLNTFIGKRLQVPPIYSALKIKGKKMYELARAGKNFTPLPRIVYIKEITLLAYTWPILEIKVQTGPGVYIRAIARDLGQKLKTGGYLSKLTRTKVGEYYLEKAYAITDFEKRKADQ